MAEQALTEHEGELRIAAALDDVQRLVVSAYAHLPWSRYVLVRIVDGVTDIDGVRAWLGSLVPAVSTASRRDETGALNIALTAQGLAALGASADTLAGFPRAFRQGMATEYRSRILGDTGASAPDRWAWGGPDEVPDLLLALFARTADELVEAADGVLEGAAAVGARAAGSIDAMLIPHSLEHFGFTDGVSQPVLAGTEWAARASAPRWESIAPGEFVLGHRDESGLVSERPTAGDVDLGMNGSYLVMRQLEQHVEAFRAYVDAAADTHGMDPDDLASELVGRHRDGRSLATGAPALPAQVTINDFGYEHDKEGLGCPLGSHVRRANPRNSTTKTSTAAEEVARRSTNRHRLLRRGRPYGPTDEHRQGDEPRGLVFIALNADLERQFEFVQHTWLNNPTFAGLAGELDPLTVEQPSVGGGPGGTFTIPARPVRRRLRSLPSFTTTRGGAYFFLPGVRALARLAAGPV